jgi:hypothetical protein
MAFLGLIHSPVLRISEMRSPFLSFVSFCEESVFVSFVSVGVSFSLLASCQH